MGGCEVTHCFILYTPKKDSLQDQITKRMRIFVHEIIVYD